MHCLVMEYADNETLRKYLQQNKLEWPEKIRLASQIAEGMSYLHSIDITHRNLHTANILIHKNDIKISDFGFSKTLNSIAIRSNKVCGAIPFIDPHILKIKIIHCSDDDLLQRIIYGLREEPITGIPARYIILYSRCWDYEQNKRPSMFQIFQQLNSLELSPKYEESNQDRFQTVIKEHKLQEISYNSLVDKKKIGHGDFGRVYRATSSSLGDVAIKELESKTDEKTQKLFINEIKRLNKYNHEMSELLNFMGLVST
ncbi:7379_t:CDS:2 [Dentiscutata heterogama]|uniref:7379_t:CDS:1 n=1 Tax=Dentiscutata heterogama TaxID=1316150 RepID=A0ACA9LUU7_9GLOM|nr:7379_t:CDS:2 [Dentiscutata heterogama]